MTVKVVLTVSAVTGLAFRRIMDLGEKSSDIEVVAINDLTTPALLAHTCLSTTQLMVLSTTKFQQLLAPIVVDGKKYRVYAEPQAQNIHGLE